MFYTCLSVHGGEGVYDTLSGCHRIDKPVQTNPEKSPILETVFGFSIK